MATTKAVPKSESRKVQSYIKAELKLRKLDDKLRAKWGALLPLRDKVQRAKADSWAKWHALNGTQASEAVRLIGDGRKTLEIRS